MGRAQVLRAKQDFRGKLNISKQGKWQNRYLKINLWCLRCCLQLQASFLENWKFGYCLCWFCSGLMRSVNFLPVLLRLLAGLWFSNVSTYQNNLKGLLGPSLWVSDSVGFRWDLGICISIKSSDQAATGPGDSYRSRCYSIPPTSPLLTVVRGAW